MSGPNINPIFTVSPWNAGTEFTSSDTTTKKQLIGAGPNGSRVEAFLFATNDTSDVYLDIYMNDGSNYYYLCTVHIPAGSGYTTVPRVDATDTIAPAAIGAFTLGLSCSIWAACHTTMTSSKVTDCVLIGGDF